MTFRLLCDENVDVGLVDALAPEFETIRVTEVEQLGPAATDPEIWTYAGEQAYLILTGDDDFVSGDARAEAVKSPGIIHADQEAATGDIVRALRAINRYVSSKELMGETVFVPGNWI